MRFTRLIWQRGTGRWRRSVALRTKRGAAASTLYRIFKSYIVLGNGQSAIMRRIPSDFLHTQSRMYCCFNQIPSKLMPFGASYAMATAVIQRGVACRAYVMGERAVTRGGLTVDDRARDRMRPRRIGT